MAVVPVLHSIPTLFTAWWCPFSQRSVIALSAKPEALQQFQVFEVPFNRGDPIPEWMSGLSGTVPFIAWKADDTDTKSSDSNGDSTKSINSSSSSSSSSRAAWQSGRPHVAISDSTVCNEFINDAFPSPPLLPADPVPRAVARTLIRQIDDVLVPRLLDFITPEVMRKRDDTSRSQAAAKLDESLTNILKQVQGPFALGEQLSLVDCCLAPHVLRMFVWKEINDYQYKGPAAGVLRRYHDALLQHPAVAASMAVPSEVGGDFSEALLNHYIRFAVAQVFR